MSYIIDTKKHCVYIHQNKNNLKIYVGYSSNTKRRWADTKGTAFNPNDRDYGHPFARAIRRDGWDGFTHHIIESFDDKAEALEAEKFWISFFRSNRRVYGEEYGYNLHEGGNVPPSNLGKKRSQEAIEKSRAKTTGRKRGDAFRQQRSEINKRDGVKPPSRKGARLSDAAKQALALVRMPPSPETRAKLSEAMKRKGWKVIDGVRVYFDKSESQ